MATAKPLNYLSEIVEMSRRHTGELAFMLGSASLAAATIALASSLHVFSLLLPAVVAALVFEAAVAAWRVHRRQGISIATTRSLLDLNAADLAELQQRLRARYRNREKRIEKRHEARVGRLTDDIGKLRAGPAADPANPSDQQSRADDDGWPPLIDAARKPGHGHGRWKAAVLRSRTLRRDRRARTMETQQRASMKAGGANDDRTQ